jgi:hypothetical protein
MECRLGRKVYSFFNNRFEHINLIQFVLALFAILLFCGHAGAIDYTLSWDANSEPDLAGYKVYYKANSSGQPSGDYDVEIDVGNVTTKTIEGLEESIIYFFAITAYDTSGLESDFSNEISTGAAITLPDAGSTPYLMTAGNEPDSLALRVEGGVLSEGFNWSLAPGSVGSLSEVTNERTVIYTAPSSIEGESATATVMLRNDAGTFLAQQDITVYNVVNISNKPATTPCISAGGSSDQFTVQGGNGYYTWSVSGPVDVVGGTGETYTFNAPNQGTFAGRYTITVADGRGFTVSFDVDVPLIISPESYTMLENSAPVNIKVLGAPYGTVFTVRQYDLNGNDVLGVEGYGTLESVASGIFTYIPEDVSKITSFVLNITANTPDDSLENIGMAQIASEQYRIIPVMTLSGYIVDDSGIGIENADVTLWSPKQRNGSTTTASDGFFSFENIPASESDYQFNVSKSGYVSREFSSGDLLAGNTQHITLTQAGDAYIEGEITINGATFSGMPVEVILSYIENGMGILVGKAISKDGKFRIDFKEDVGNTEYILTAIRPGEYGQITVGTLPQSGVIIDIDTPLYGDDVNALAGGSSRHVTIAGQSVSIVRVPFGGIDPASSVADINIDITTVANSNSRCTSGSGNLLYNIDMDQDITVILTLPFKLAKVFPGDFENGYAVIYHADTVDDLISETNLKAVSVDDIISVDYIGDGSTGLVEFYTDSLSVFGIGSDIGLGNNDLDDSTSTDNPSVGSISTDSSSGGGGGGGCFIVTAAYDSCFEPCVESLNKFDTSSVQRIAITLGILVIIGFVALSRSKGSSIHISVISD